MSTTSFVFDKAACIKKLDEVGKATVAFKNRAGYDVDKWLAENVTPLDARLNVKNEKTKELQDAILALPSVPNPTAPAQSKKDSAKIPVSPAKK